MKTKQGLEAEYAEYVAKNSDDGYSKACIDAGEAVATKLDEGSSAKDALDALYGHGLTGFMATMAVRGVAHFHPRGEEVRVAWNEKNGVESESGIVNTAVVNIEDNGTVSPEIEAV